MSEYKAHIKPIDKNMMKMFLDHPDYMRRIMITENQADLVRDILDSGEPSVTSRTLAKMRGVSVQSASNQLAKLWFRGYLERREVVCPSGGVIYAYKTAF